MPFKPVPIREDCPEGGKHDYKHSFAGQACQISMCRKCGQWKYRCYSTKSRRSEVLKDIAEFEKKIETGEITQG